MWFCPRCGHDASEDGMCPRDLEPLVRVSQHDLLGRPLGEYKVLATLGGGSFGTVYRAVHQRSGMLAAIKLLHRPVDDAESKRVLVEARAAAMLAHPNVVQVYDLALTSDRRPYIVMQLLEGQSLAHLLARPMSIATVLSITNDVLLALAVAHQRGVIHRDLKPDNIFVTKGRAMIVDFGLAKLVADPRSPSLTATGEALGTPHYMAPEQVRGEAADGRADLYAVGCVMFEMLAGRPPFGGPDANATFAIFDAHLHKQPPSISQLRSDVPPVIEAVIARALAKDAGSRYATAAEMQRALTGPAPRKRRWPFVVAGGAVLAAAIVVGALVAPGTKASANDEISNVGPSVGSSVGSGALGVPGPLPDEPALDSHMEQALVATAAGIDAGHYKHADIARMRCGFQQAMGPGVHPPTRAYARRMVKLLQDRDPKFDPAVDCQAGLPQPTTTARKVAAPVALPDELPLDNHMETVIATMHEQLDLGRLPATVSRAMHCDFVRQDREIVANRGSVPRLTRSMHRRIAILIEAYHPGATKDPCR